MTSFSKTLVAGLALFGMVAVNAQAPMMAPMAAPMAAPADCDNIVTALSSSPDTALLVQLIAAVLPADAVAQLADPAGNWTVFAPPADVLNSLTTAYQAGTVDDASFVAILTTHVVPDVLEAADLVALDGVDVDTLNPEESLMIMISGDSVMIASDGNTTATVTTADVDACSESSIIHLIDGVLLPAGIVLPTDLPMGAPLNEDGTTPSIGLTGDRGLPVGEPTEEGSSAAGVATGWTVAVAALFAMVL